MRFLGVDVGGTTIKAGLVDQTGQVLESRSTPTIIDDLGGFLSNLTELIRDFQKSCVIDAVGVGIPGLRNIKTQNIEVSPNIPCLNGVNLAKAAADQLRIEVVTENDANAGAYGEFVCGAGHGLQHMIYLTIGTGLGSGIVLNGKLYTGVLGYAGELGHTIVQPNGRLCACGNRGSLETLVSATGMVATAQEKGRRDLVTSAMIYDAAVRGDAIAISVFEETGYWLGGVCANLINLLNPNMIVLAGGVMASGPALLQPAIDAARRYAFPPAFNECRIVQSTLWPDAGIIGAALLARDRNNA